MLKDKPIMFDLKKVEVSETAILPLRDASDQPLPGASVTLYGPGSMPFRNAVTRWRKRNKKLESSAGDEQAFLKSNSEFLADITAGFTGVEYEDLSGREMYLAIYSNPKLGFIVNQLLAATSDWGKFSPESPTS